MMSPAEPTPETPDPAGDGPPGVSGRPAQIPPTATRTSIFESDLDSGEPDWPAQATTTIVNLVGLVRDKTTGSVLKAARGLVYGLLAGILALVVGITLLILSVRFITELTGQVWIAYLILGFVFTTAGMILFRKRLTTSH